MFPDSGENFIPRNRLYFPRAKILETPPGDRYPSVVDIGIRRVQRTKECIYDKNAFLYGKSDRILDDFLRAVHEVPPAEKTLPQATFSGKQPP
jgi:hypothetical protein